MTTLTLQLQRESGPRREPKRLVRLRESVRGAGRAVAQAVLAPHRASLTRLAEMPLAVVGTGLVDWSAFHLNGGVGLLVTGVSLWLVEHLISDDESQ